MIGSDCGIGSGCKVYGTGILPSGTANIVYWSLMSTLLLFILHIAQLWHSPSSIEKYAAIRAFSSLLNIDKIIIVACFHELIFYVYNYDVFVLIINVLTN